MPLSLKTFVNMDVAMKNEKTLNKTELPSHHQDFVETQNYCPLCGTHLKITVEIEVGTFTLHEEATCENCDVLARVKCHRMH